MSANDRTTPPAILIQGTHGADNPEKATLPFMIGAAPFGVIFGALATSQENPLSVFETMALSMFVFSGSAQFVAIALIAVSTPAWVIWVVTLILNLRHTLYAATLVGYVRHLPVGWRFFLSAGLTDELITFYLARDLIKVAAGGGDASEKIVVHEIPVEGLSAWLCRQADAGKLIDYKIAAGMWLAGHAGGMATG